jgi:surface polysaccharide O-acyltransferase-like enzyme
MAGPETHLWFLPFAFVATVATGLWLASHAATNDRAARRSAIAWAVAAALLLVVASYVMELLQQRERATGQSFQPMKQWLRVVPVSAVGVAIVRARIGGKYDRTAIIAIGALMVVAAIICFASGWRDIAPAYALSIPLCLVGLHVRYSASDMLINVASLTLGVFLLHPMLFDVWYFITNRAGLLGLFPLKSDRNALAMSAFAILGSALIVVVLRRTPLRRFV